jgi:RES domain-containing protein
MRLAPTELWRISDFTELNGEGGLFYRARWNTIGHPIVYLAESAAGTLLEVLVHLELEDTDMPGPYNLLRVTLPSEIRIEKLHVPNDPAWKRNERLTQAIGDEWLRSTRSALAVVPSAIMPETRNYLLNPEHPDAKRIKVAEITQAYFDPRLLRKANI